MRTLFSFLVMVLTGCSSFSQKAGQITIDPNLHNDFFDIPDYITEGTDSLFTDSIMVEVNNYSDTSYDQGRSNIRNSNLRYYTFYDCEGSFQDDTLVVKFFNKSDIRLDTITLNIIGDAFFSDFSFTDYNEIHATEPQILKFKKRINKNGDKVFGELKIKALDSKTKDEFIFSGPFMCTVK